MRRIDKDFNVSVPNEQEIQRLCEFWQRILKLQDWEVDVKVTRAQEISAGNMGQVEWNINNRSAKIQILDPIDYDPEKYIPYDFQHTLVHELLHLHFALCEPEPKTIQETLFEQALNAIASALVKLAITNGADNDAKVKSVKS